MIGIATRIFLRWLAGFLVAKGLFAPDDAQMLTADPELERTIVAGLGLAAGAVAEGWFYLAKRFGWNT